MPFPYDIVLAVVDLIEYVFEPDGTRVKPTVQSLETLTPPITPRVFHELVDADLHALLDDLWRDNRRTIDLLQFCTWLNIPILENLLMASISVQMQRMTVHELQAALPKSSSPSSTPSLDETSLLTEYMSWASQFA